MDRKTLLAVVGAAAIGGAVMGGLQFAEQVIAAPGDVVPTSPRTDTGLTLDRICLDADGPTAILVYTDSFGHTRTARVRNGTSTGFDYATGAPVSVSTPNAFTTFRSDLGVTNAKVTTAVGNVRTAGIIVMPGTIQ